MKNQPTISTYGQVFIDFLGEARLHPERILVRHVLDKYYDGGAGVQPPAEPVGSVPQHQVQVVSLGPGVVVQT